MSYDFTSITGGTVHTSIPMCAATRRHSGFVGINTAHYSVTIYRDGKIAPETEPGLGVMMYSAVVDDFGNLVRVAS